MKLPCVYILASGQNRTLYTGVTSNLPQRVGQHRMHLAQGFTRNYGVDRLVWYEVHPSMVSAIQREKRIKSWKRDWKLRLIEEQNPDWRDLYDEIAR